MRSKVVCFERAPGVATSIGAMVFASNRGSLQRKYKTDRQRFIAEYGSQRWVLVSESYL